MALSKELSQLASLTTVAGTTVTVAGTLVTSLTGDVTGNVTGTASGLSATLAPASGGTGATTLAGASITTYAGVESLSNKRIAPRISSVASIASPWAWNGDNYDEQCLTALANALTISADAGTPVDGQKTIFRFKDNGTAQALTWTIGATNAFRALGVTLPTTTIVNKTLYAGCIYNGVDSRWDVVVIAQEA